jgi:hypothetical protein
MQTFFCIQLSTQERCSFQAKTKEIITNYNSKFPQTSTHSEISCSDFRYLKQKNEKSVHNRFPLVNIVIDFAEGSGVAL